MAGPARRRVRRRRAAASRSRRRARPGRGPQGARGRRGGRSPPAARRPARRRQDDAGPATHRAAAAAHAGDGARGHDGALGGRCSAARRRAWSAGRRSGHRTTAARWSSLVGGGTSNLRPGEISLAHGGVLFLDELGEFSPVVLDGLRQPLEEGVIRVARARASATLPARFLLVAATNPCPCGGGPPGACECDDGARLRYLRRLSRAAARSLRPPRRRALAPTSTICLHSGGGESTAVVARTGGWPLALRRSSASGMLNSAIPASQLDELAPLSAAPPGCCCAPSSSANGSPARLPPHPPRRPHHRRSRRRSDGSGRRTARGSWRCSSACGCGSSRRRAGRMSSEPASRRRTPRRSPRFPHMTMHRLGALLRHHAPDEAYAVAVGEPAAHAG